MLVCETNDDEQVTQPMDAGGWVSQKLCLKLNYTSTLTGELDIMWNYIERETELSITLDIKDKVHLKTEESKKFLLKSNVVFSAVIHIHWDPEEQNWPRKRSRDVISLSTSARGVLKKQQTEHPPLGPWTVERGLDSSLGSVAAPPAAATSALAWREPSRNLTRTIVTELHLCPSINRSDVWAGQVASLPCLLREVGCMDRESSCCGNMWRV